MRAARGVPTFARYRGFAISGKRESMNATHRNQATKTRKKAATLIEALEQRIAPAGVFRWNATGGGSWTNPANWTLISGSAGAGFPDNVGDEAQLYNSITANSIITIPDNTEITLGKLRFDDNNSYTVSALGSGHLTMESSTGTAVIQSTNANGAASQLITAPITLHSDTTVINVTANPLVLQCEISDDLFYRAVTKHGTGVVTFSGASANTYTGTTTVLDGTLRLAKSSQVNAVGQYDVTIGEFDGVGAPRLVLDASEQIPDTTTVSVLGNGALDLANASETVKILGLADTAAITTGTGTLTVSQVYAYAYENGAISTISGNLQLVNESEIHVGLSSAGGGLNISAIIKGSTGLNKTGGGELELSPLASQQYTGRTAIYSGMLELTGTTGDGAISNDIVIASNGTLRISSPFEVPDSATITIEGGRLEVAAIEDCSHVVLDHGTIAIEETATFAIRPNGSVTVLENANFGASSIEGAGKFRINDGTIAFDIQETADDIDLRISAPMVAISATAVLAKAGNGKLELAGEGNFLGGINVQGGVLLLTNDQAAPITVSGGTVEFGQYAQISVPAISATGGRIVPGLYGSSGNLTLGSGAVYAPYLDYFMRFLGVTGTVNLSNASLDLSVLGLPPSFYETAIIDNDGVDPVVGTFAGLPEGATVKTAGGDFIISYTGGTGNDVTLTPLAAIPTILPGGKAATYVDSDGDLVTVRITKGTLTADNFRLIAKGLGAELAELTLENPSFEGTNLKISVRSRSPAILANSKSVPRAPRHPHSNPWWWIRSVLALRSAPRVRASFRKSMATSAH